MAHCLMILVDFCYKLSPSHSHTSENTLSHTRYFLKPICRSKQETATATESNQQPDKEGSRYR